MSDPALEKFIKDNFDKSWSKFDNFERGSIDVLETVPFIRDLMQSMAPPPSIEEPNPF